MDARKNTLGKKDALALLKEVNDVYAAKGKHVLRFNVKKDNAEDIVAAMLGPSGNLRAPTLRKGRTLLVGFDEATYQSVFG